MRCDRLELTGDPASLAAEIRALVAAPESVQSPVATIVAEVRARGDEAVREYTVAFDTQQAVSRGLLVDPAELVKARDQLEPAVRAGLELAIDNVRRVAEAWLTHERVVAFGGHKITLREIPVARAAVYVPGGRAPYPSTVVMGVTTAQAAGVAEIAVCSPPGSEGEIDTTVLAACELTGASAVYRMGGAQAIAALAYGTESVDAVDVIVGPGNLYVQEAKRQVSGEVGIDGFAGPSDLMVIADASVDPEPAALDLLAQSEHGPGTLVVGVSDARDVIERWAVHLDGAPETGAIAIVVSTADLEAALGLAEAFAPEHLQLIGGEAEALAGRVTRSGCVFVGAGAGTAFGDYIAGSNHILPTNGAARFASGLSPAHFRRRYAEVAIEGAAAALARAAAPVARAEGFEYHARSMEARIRENHTG